jgi:hypothetical protein
MHWQATIHPWYAQLLQAIVKYVISLQLYSNMPAFMPSSSSSNQPYAAAQDS